MEGLIIFALLVLGGIFIGAIFGCVAFFQNNALKTQISFLRRRIEVLEMDSKNTHSQASLQEQVDNTAKQTETTEVPEKSSAKVGSNTKPAILPHKIEAPEKPHSSSQYVSQSKAAKPSVSWPDVWLQSVKSNWMIWLGGASIGLSGVFLVKYSIDEGLLGPTARIALALLAGVAFHVLALWLKRRSTTGADAFAALAGGASICLYSAMLAALHLYTLWPPGAVFVVLIAISLATMGLALIHGPVLAGIGILGAYLVPILVNTGSNNVLGALIYVAIINFSALWLLRYVYRDWLWYGTLVGAFAWWVISVPANMLDGSRLVYLLALAYSLIAVPNGDWLLKKTRQLNAEGSIFELLKAWDEKQDKYFLFAIFAVIAASFISILKESMALPSVLFILALPVFILYLAQYRNIYSLLAWPVVAASFLGVLVNGLIGGQAKEYSFFEGQEAKGLAVFLTSFVGIVFLMSWRQIQRSQYKGYWASLTFLSPVVALAIAYILITALRAHWEWSIASLMLGVSYFIVLKKQQGLAGKVVPSEVAATLIIAGHFAYSLAVVMYFREATLSLAFAVQAISLVWLEGKYKFPVLIYATKIVLLVVIARLTLNPWLMSYSNELHWSLWVCGGATVATFIAAYFASERQNLQQWLQGAGLHLFALTVFYEIRYQLYDGEIFQQVYSFTEAALNTAVWGALGNVYLYRAKPEGRMQTFYTWCAYILLLASVANYGFSLVLKYSPLWGGSSIGETPIFNMLLLAYGFPVLLCGVCYLQIAERLKIAAGAVGAFTLLYFVNIEIRHLWQGAQMSIFAATTDGEHYTYSMAWLVLAVVGTVLGIRFARDVLYRGAMIFLLVVVAKIFLFDMAGLTGLWRVASFLALGFCLLGVAWFHQKIRTNLTTGVI